MDRLGEALAKRIIHPRRRSGPVNQTTDTTLDTSREERPPDGSSLMWPRWITSPWLVYKQDLMKLNLQTLRFAGDSIRLLTDWRETLCNWFVVDRRGGLVDSGTKSTSALRQHYGWLTLRDCPQTTPWVL